ncbi:hypothetical protein ACYPKM_02505 [Pseudomonas aeruginosa]
MTITCKHCLKEIEPGQPAHGVLGMHWECSKQHFDQQPNSPLRLSHEPMSQEVRVILSADHKRRQNRPDGPVWRDIISYRAHKNAGYEKSKFVGGSWAFTLECTHVTHRKLSEAVPKSRQMRCIECEKIRDSVKPVGWRWDWVTYMPIKVPPLEDSVKVK